MRIIVLSAFLVGVLAWLEVKAQAPSTSLLLRPAAEGQQQEVELDSSRYRVKPRNTTETEAATRRPRPQAKQPQQKETEKAPASGEPAQPISESTQEQKDADFKEQMRDLILGGPKDKITDFKKNLHPSDPRNNLLEVGLAPSYIYLDSTSNYSFRNYISQGPGLAAHARMWVTPFFGINADYLTSLSADVIEGPQGSNYIEAEHERYEAGIRFRKFFGYTRKAPELSLGLDYSEYQFNVPKNASERVGLKSTGMRLMFEAVIPKFRTQAYILGASYTPRVNLKEVNTELSLKSGTKSDTDRVSFWFGSRYRFDRKFQVYWRASHSMQKTVYRGEANQVDPKTSTQPTGVSVTESLSIIQVGFTWGS